MGLSIFTWDNKSSSYKFSTISSHIFQRPVPDTNITYKSFLSDPLCLEFLSKHNFDFNKWIYDGKQIYRYSGSLLIFGSVCRPLHVSRRALYKEGSWREGFATGFPESDRGAQLRSEAQAAITSGIVRAAVFVSHNGSLILPRQKIVSWIVHSFNEPTVVDIQSRICAAILNDLISKRLLYR